MKVQQFHAKNQFIITDGSTIVFQSYDSVIARKRVLNYLEADRLGKNPNEYVTELDKNYWDYSVTTGKYRNKFLGETKKETEKKIKSGEYILTDLN